MKNTLDNIKVTLKIDVKLTLWSAIKLRIAGFVNLQKGLNKVTIESLLGKGMP